MRQPEELSPRLRYSGSDSDVEENRLSPMRPLLLRAGTSAHRTDPTLRTHGRWFAYRRAGNRIQGNPGSIAQSQPAYDLAQFIASKHLHRRPGFAPNRLRDARAFSVHGALRSNLIPPSNHRVAPNHSGITSQGRSNPGRHHPTTIRGIDRLINPAAPGSAVRCSIL